MWGVEGWNRQLAPDSIVTATDFTLARNTVSYRQVHYGVRVNCPTTGRRTAMGSYSITNICSLASPPRTFRILDTRADGQLTAAYEADLSTAALYGTSH